MTTKEEDIFIARYIDVSEKRSLKKTTLVKAPSRKKAISKFWISRNREVIYLLNIKRKQQKSRKLRM